MHHSFKVYAQYNAEKIYFDVWDDFAVESSNSSVVEISNIIGGSYTCKLKSAGDATITIYQKSKPENKVSYSVRSYCGIKGLIKNVNYKEDTYSDKLYNDIKRFSQDKIDNFYKTSRNFA